MYIRRPLTIHSLLFAIYPILHLYASNIDRVAFAETLMPLAVSLGMTIVLYLVLRLLFGESNKAGILTSATLVLFFSYGHTWKALGVLHRAMWGGEMQQHGYLLLLWSFLLLAAALVVVKIGRDLRAITTCLNVVAALLMATSLLTVAIHTVSHPRFSPTRASPEILSQFEVAEKLPDIYYIILDGYARQDILREVYDYDNSEFIAQLTRHGFYVAGRSRSNYAMTDLSLASSLNMKYLNYLSTELGVGSSDTSIVRSMITDNRVCRTLKGAGYRFLHFSSGYAPTEYNEFAEINYRPEVLNDFRTALLETTVLNPLVVPVGAAQKRAGTLFTFETIGKVPQIEEPTFVFAHLMVPHPRFVFDSDCSAGRNTQTRPFVGASYDATEYVDQLICVNKMVERLVDEILANSEVSPIIVLQADHGWESTDEWRQPTRAFLRERMGILNAFYLPGDGRSELYPSITPVNTFRLAFDLYLGTNLGLLEDKSYFSNYTHPYEFIQVAQ